MSRILRCIISGVSVEREIADDRTLVAFLREDIGLTGTNEDCGGGDCGAYIWPCWLRGAASPPLRVWKKTIG